MRKPSKRRRDGKEFGNQLPVDNSTDRLKLPAPQKEQSVPTNTKKRGKTWEDIMELNSYDPAKRRKHPAQGLPEVIVYNGRPMKPPAVSEAVDVPQEASVKDISHEVYQFGISGFDYEDKERMEEQRAIKLGAKPPKNSYIPYKELMELRKQQRTTELHQREIDRKMGFKARKMSTGNASNKSSLLRGTGFWQDPSKDKRFRVDGQLGRYRQGIQVLNKQDIQRIKGKRTKERRISRGKKNK